MEVKFKRPFYSEELGQIGPGVFIIPDRYKEKGKLPKSAQILKQPTEGKRARVNAKVVEVEPDQDNLDQAELENASHEDLVE